MKPICYLALAFVLPVGTLAAQQAPTLAPGSRVRITTPTGRVIGTLESIDSSTIIVRRRDGRAANLGRVQGTRVDVSAGPGTCSPGHRGTCIAVGFLGGTALGVAAGAIAVGNCNTDLCELYYLVTVPAGALVGTVVGAVVGWEHWNAADLPVRLTLAPNVPNGLEPSRSLRLGVRLAL